MKFKIMFLVLMYFLQEIKNQENHYFFRCGVDDKNQTMFPVPNYYPIDGEKRKLNDGDFKDFNIYLDFLNIKYDIKKFRGI